MCDNWEDWESDDYVVPILSIPTAEKLTRLEEQKMIEDSDIELARDLIDYKKINQIINIANTYVNDIPVVKKEKSKKQKENEEKQKCLSKKLKEEKTKREKAKEIFGEADEDNEYKEYEDMFY